MLGTDKDISAFVAAVLAAAIELGVGGGVMVGVGVPMPMPLAVDWGGCATAVGGADVMAIAVPEPSWLRCAVDVRTPASTATAQPLPKSSQRRRRLRGRLVVPGTSGFLPAINGSSRPVLGWAHAAPQECLRP